MESEALTKIRTMRQIKSSLDVAGRPRVKTTNGLSKAPAQSESADHPKDGLTMQVLAKEKARTAAYENSVKKSRQRLLSSRDRLAAIISRNLALTELRHDLQRSRYQKVEVTCSPAPAAQKETLAQSGLRQVDLEY